MILFSGGEPFLRSNFVPIFCFFTERFPASRLVILSNCFNTTLIEKKLKEIFGRFPKMKFVIGTSLDGMGDTHDRVRGTPGAFEKLNETLSLVRSSFPVINLEANFTITPENHSQLLETYQFSKEMEMGFNAQFPIPWEGVRRFRWDEEDLAEVGSAIEKIMEDIYEREKIGPGFVPLHTLVRLHYLKGLLDYQLNPRRIFPRCPAGRRFAMFSSRGDLYFCPPLKDKIIGKVRKTPFDKLWISTRAERIRKYIDSGNCHCWLNCTAPLNMSDALKIGQPAGRKLIQILRRKALLREDQLFLRRKGLYPSGE